MKRIKLYLQVRRSMGGHTERFDRTAFVLLARHQPVVSLNTVA